MQEVGHRISLNEESVESLHAQLREVRQRLAFFQDAGNSFQRRLDDIVDAAVHTVEHVETERRSLESEVDGLRRELADLQQTLDHSQAQTQVILDQARQEARQLVEEAKSRTLGAIRLALQHLDDAPSPSISFSEPSSAVAEISQGDPDDMAPAHAFAVVEPSAEEVLSEHVGEFAPFVPTGMEPSLTESMAVVEAVEPVGDGLDETLQGTSSLPEAEDESTTLGGRGALVIQPAPTPLPAPALVPADDDGVTLESITRLHIRAGGDNHTDELVRALDEQFGTGSVAVANRDRDESDLLVTHPQGSSLLRALLSVKGLDFRPVGRGDGFLEIEIRAA